MRIPSIVENLLEIQCGGTCEIFWIGREELKK